MSNPAAISIATQLIAQCEGCVLTPYQDAAGVWTIGYGTTRLPDGTHVQPTTPAITLATAQDWLARDLAKTAAVVDSLVPADTTDEQRAALFSFAYNTGTNALRGSTLLRLFLAGDVAGAAAEFPKWVYAGGHMLRGLVKRRSLEQGVFLGTVKFTVAPAPADAHIPVTTDVAT